MGWRVWLIALVAAATACDGARAAPDAAGADAGATWPIPPAPPVLTPCPDGWREVTDASGLVTCDPWPESGYRDDCAFDEAHFPGTPGCARVGTSCPKDGWPEELPTDRPIVYVDDEAAPGGDGVTRATAYASLSDAATLSPADTLIAVATGRYDVRTGITLRSGTLLWGACVAEVRLTSSVSSDNEATVTLLAGAGARNLSVDTPVRVGVFANGTDTSLLDVVVAGARGRGVVVQGKTSTLTARGIVVRDTASRTDGMLALGVEVGLAARLVVERAVLERNNEHGLAAGRGTTVAARDLAIRATRPRADGTRGLGILANTDVELTLERAALEGNGEVGLVAEGPDTTLDVRDAVIRDTLPRPDGTLGRGIQAVSGASMALQRIVVERNREVGLSASDEGTTVDIRNSVLRNTTQEGMGFGLQVISGARVVLAHVVLDRNQAGGLIATGAGTTAEVQDALIRDTEPRVDGTGGRGIEAGPGALLSLERVLVERNRDVGVMASGIDTAVVARDLVVRDMVDAPGSYGAGLLVQSGAVLDGTGIVVERIRFVGIGALTGATVTLSGARTSRVEPSTSCRVCTGEAGGFGLSAHFGGRLTARDFTVDEAALCGVVVGADDAVIGPTGMDLANGVIERAPVGACVQVDGYDTSRLRNMVEYRDVGVPLQATSYELPDALPGL